jgi:hypothetical protein
MFPHFRQFYSEMGKLHWDQNLAKKKKKKSQTPPTTIETICLGLNTHGSCPWGLFISSAKYIELKNLFSRQLGQIRCRFLPPGGSMSLRYVLQLLFGKKLQK